MKTSSEYCLDHSFSKSDGSPFESVPRRSSVAAYHVEEVLGMYRTCFHPGPPISVSSSEIDGWNFTKVTHSLGSTPFVGF